MMADWAALTDPSVVIAALDALSRTRALSLDESLALEHAIKVERKKQERCGARRWSSDQDEIALSLKRQRVKVGVIAKRVGRSKDAVYARIRYLEQQPLSPCIGRRG